MSTRRGTGDRSAVSYGVSDKQSGWMWPMLVQLSCCITLIYAGISATFSIIYYPFYMNGKPSSAFPYIAYTQLLTSSSILKNLAMDIRFRYTTGRREELGSRPIGGIGGGSDQKIRFMFDVVRNVDKSDYCKTWLKFRQQPVFKFYQICYIVSFISLLHYPICLDCVPLQDTLQGLVRYCIIGG
ncbi:MAG: hypothetical protein EZS28_012842 [Streblomastix strix]|uniref:Uncharacterized protein n=1 Tax=Streblomastix strix TaxID=222440 RepID=A0A5J4WAF3_9EUKA|nr:MAG: hypothetical protein EZS28_012842 [Streblomastix strix]